MEKPTKQLRVHNWSGIFLERLNEFYSKTDHCDVTLQFDGNAQLKVHRLVLNVCSNFFGPAIINDNLNESSGEAIVIMPPDLQADVMLPIINFMYTGLLDYETSMFSKLYKAADLLHMPVLTKLLDSQRTSSSSINLLNKNVLKRKTPIAQTHNATLLNAMKKFKPLTSIPSTSPCSSTSNLMKRKKQIYKFKQSEPQTSVKSSSDQAKPFRFDWPDDYEPEVRPTDVDFGSIPKKAIITYNDYAKVYGNDDMCANNNNSPPSNSLIDIDSMKDYVKEQKIRTDLMNFEKEYEDDYNITKIETKVNNKKDVEEETTLTIKMKNIETELDHTKIISEVLKKYPDIVKKNKNIRLKIMSDSPKTPQKTIKLTSQLQDQQTPVKKVETNKLGTQLRKKSAGNTNNDSSNTTGPWNCTKCGHHPEFALYYLYRKHMIDEHNEHYDNNQCKYCGKKCKNQLQLDYHVITEHNLQTSKTNFPKCQQCAYIAPNVNSLAKHTKMHTLDEVKCNVCELVFLNKQMMMKHLQITNHYRSTNASSSKNRSEYDCQYCMKRYKAAMNLYTHMKQLHNNEVERDGILLYFDLDVEDTSDEEMIQNKSKNKVNIISDIKVDQQLDTITTNDLSNVANSLGLVDIVVFNEDDQQYILQQHQPSQIITTTNNSTQNQSDITSTDELVMVLTDHDYNNEDNENIIETNQGEASNNSNIVVLYSHPCDASGQQSFITTQGNLMVNSETGLIEIHQNPTTSSESIVTTTPTQSGQDGQIESIEMIQREIESHIQQETETNPTTTQLDESMEEKTEFTANEQENLSQEQEKENFEAPSFEQESNNQSDIKQETVINTESTTEQSQEEEKQPEKEVNNEKSNEDLEIRLTDDLTTIIEENNGEKVKEPEEAVVEAATTVDEPKNQTESAPIEQETEKVENKETTPTAQSNITNVILDDWDDTDSQQSDKPNIMLLKENVTESNNKDDVGSNGIKSKQTVNKIMDEWDIKDEWENDDEDEIRKENVSNDL